MIVCYVQTGLVLAKLQVWSLMCMKVMKGHIHSIKTRLALLVNNNAKWAMMPHGGRGRRIIGHHQRLQSYKKR